MSHQPWSHSKKSVADQCPRRFYHKYVARPRTHKEYVSSSAGRIGNAVHILLENLVQGRNSKSTFIRAVSGLTSEEIFEVKAYRDGIFRFLERFDAWCKKRNVAPCDVYPEMGVAFTEDGEIVDYWDKRAFWRGKLDLGVKVRDAKTGDVSMVIIDHKTGTRKPDKEAAYHEQLNAYVIGAFYMDPSIVGVQTLLHWVGEDLREDMYAFGPYRDRADIELNLIPKFFDAYNATEQAATTYVDEDTSPPQEDYYCSWCEYAYCCPLKA